MKEVIGKQDHHPQIEGVLVSLEEQIDALCSELKSANSALRAKDKLFADLEQERKAALKKMASVASPEDPRKLSSIQEGTEDDKQKMQIAATKMMCKVFENRSKSDAACALRKWSNAAAAQHAEDQKHAAHEALSKQLETTRSKLVQLKTQFKKSKVGAKSDNH